MRPRPAKVAEALKALGVNKEASQRRDAAGRQVSSSPKCRCCHTELTPGLALVQAFGAETDIAARHGREIHAALADLRKVVGAQ
jgi:hypothetical protein